MNLGILAAGAFHWIDYVTIGVYVLVLIALGIHFSKGQKGLEDYFLAGRSMGWKVIAVSFVASLHSAISYLGCPGESYANDLKYSLKMVAQVIAIPAIIYLFINFFYKLKIISSYEYLEMRFNYPVRALASVFFILLRVSWMATIVIASSIAVSAIADIEMWQCIVLVSAIATFYTYFGGMKAVIWTDVLQFCLFVGGATIALIWVCTHNSVTELIAVASKHQKFTMFDFRWDVTFRFTTWGVILGGFVLGLANSTDQVGVQRYLAAKSLRDAQKAVFLRPLFSLPLLIILYLLGIALFSHYQLNPELAQGLENADNVFPFFIVHEIPSGLSGLIIAAVFAAAMSSIDSGIHTLTTVSIQDHYKRWIRPGASDEHYLRVSRVLIIVWGALFMVTALAFGKSLGSIVDMIGSLMGPFAGCIVGIFLLGTGTRRTTSRGALAGGVIGYVIVMWTIFGCRRIDGQWDLRAFFSQAENQESINYMWYPVISLVGTFMSGYLISLLRPDKRPAATKGLNIWQRT